MKVFIPFTDEMLESGRTPGELVPFQPDHPFLCRLPANGKDHQSSSSVNTDPGPTPNSPALPAFSSKTYIAGPELG